MELEATLSTFMQKEKEKERKLEEKEKEMEGKEKNMENTLATVLQRVSDLSDQLSSNTRRTSEPDRRARESDRDRTLTSPSQEKQSEERYRKPQEEHTSRTHRSPARERSRDPERHREHRSSRSHRSRSQERSRDKDHNRDEPHPRTRRGRSKERSRDRHQDDHSHSHSHRSRSPTRRGSTPNTTHNSDEEDQDHEQDILVGNFFQKKLGLLKKYLKDKIPETTSSIPRKPSMADAHVHKATVLDKLSLPLAPAVTTALEITSYQTTHNNHGLPSNMSKGKFIPTKTKPAYLIQDTAWATDMTKENDLQALLYNSNSKPDLQVPVKTITTIESGTRKLIPALAYGQWFVSGVTETLEQATQILDKEYLDDGDLDNLYSILEDAQSLNTSTEQSIIDATLVGTTTLANLQLAIRDTYLPAMPRNVSDTTKALVRSKPTSFTHLFGGDIAEEVKLFKDTQDKDANVALTAFMQRTASRRGTSRPRGGFARGIKNQPFQSERGGGRRPTRGRGRGRGRYRGNRGRESYNSYNRQDSREYRGGQDRSYDNRQPYDKKDRDNRR